MKYVLFALFVIAYKAISNYVCFRMIEKYEGEYVLFPTGDNTIYEHRQHVIKLWKRAGIADVCIPMAQKMGYGQLASMKVSIFTNFPSLQTVQYGPALNMFSEAKGVYRSRIFESFNPLYWIDLIIFLPKNVLLYLGMDDEKAPFKILNVFFQALWWVVCTVVILFHDEVKDLALKIINRF